MTKETSNVLVDTLRPSQVYSDHQTSVLVLMLIRQCVMIIYLFKTFVSQATEPSYSYEFSLGLNVITDDEINLISFHN